MGAKRPAARACCARLAGKRELVRPHDAPDALRPERPGVGHARQRTVVALHQQDAVPLDGGRRCDAVHFEVFRVPQTHFVPAPFLLDGHGLHLRICIP